MRDAALGEDAPVGGNSFDGLTEEQKKNQDDFYAQNKDGEDPMKTMMMSMYMLGALEYFDGMDKMEIKKIAFEIAMIGTTGISPDKKSGYKSSFYSGERLWWLSALGLLLCKLGIGNTRDAGILGTSIRYSLGYSSGNVEEEKGQSIN